MRPRWKWVLILGIRGLIHLGGWGEGKQKKGKTKAEYESNMSALASALVSRLDKGVSSEKSKQSGPQEELTCQVVDIVSKLTDLSEQQIVNAFEFFRLTQMPCQFFLGCKCVLGVATFAQLYCRLYGFYFLLFYCCDLLDVLIK